MKKKYNTFYALGHGCDYSYPEGYETVLINHNHEQEFGPELPEQPEDADSTDFPEEEGW